MAAWVLLEVVLAIPLRFGHVSLAAPLCWWAAAHGAPPGEILLALCLALLIRCRGRLRPAWPDLAAAAVSAAACRALGPTVSLPVLLLAAGPLTAVLRAALKPDQEPDELPFLVASWLGLCSLAPLATQLHGAALLWLVPLYAGLRSSLQSTRQLRHFKEHRVGVRQQVRQVVTTHKQQQAEGQRLEAQAATFRMLEQLGNAPLDLPAALERIGQLVQSAQPEAVCGFQAPGTPSQPAPYTYPAAGGTLWLRLPQPDAALADFVRLSVPVVERAILQGQLLQNLHSETSFRQRLQYLLSQAPRLASEPPARVGKEVAAALGSDEVASQSRKLWGVLVEAAVTRSQAQSELAVASRLAAVGQLAAGLAHELNTPLGAITVAMTVARQCLESRPERAVGRLNQALQAAGHMQTVIDKLLVYARGSGQGRRDTDLAALIKDTVSFLQLGDLELSVQAEPLHAEVDAGEIQQVLVNLLGNARLALAGRPEPRRLSVRLAQHGQQAWCDIADNGPGVPNEIAERIFEPFFTTREVGQGSGLGLAISRQIAISHGGSLEAVAVSQGACFRLKLPLP